MLFLNRLDGSEFVVSAEHVLLIERTPDTVLTLTNGTHVMVKQSVEEVVERAVAYRRRCLAGPQVESPEPAQE